MRDVILMRHGHALSPEFDPERGLSRGGQVESEKVALQIASDGIRVDRIVHSVKKRAEETARILQKRIAPDVSIERRRGLAPNDDVGDIAMEIEKTDLSVAVVGHLPHLPSLLAELLDLKEVPLIGTSCAVHLRRSDGVWSVVNAYMP